MQGKAHLNTLSSALLNSFWRGVCWIIYLFICYASLVAYMSGGGKEIAFVLNEIFDLSYSNVLGIIVFSLLFAAVLFLGHQFLERVNTLMFFSMIFAYIMVIANSGKSINSPFLLRQEWGSDLFFITPLMLTTFSFPGIVPTIVPYLNKDQKSVKLAIISTLYNFCGRFPVK